MQKEVLMPRYKVNVLVFFFLVFLCLEKHKRMKTGCYVSER